MPRNDVCDHSHLLVLASYVSKTVQHSYSFVRLFIDPRIDFACYVYRILFVEILFKYFSVFNSLRLTETKDMFM